MMVPLDYPQTSPVAVKGADRCFCQKKKKQLFPCAKAETENTGFLHVKANKHCSTCEERMLSKECMCPNHNQRMYDKKLFFSSDKFALTTIFPCPCFFHAKYSV